jgi:hypothetical protein
MDEQQIAEPKKRGRPRKPEIVVAPRSDESTWSPDDIIAKRLAGEPFGLRSDQIPMREPGKWALRISNSGVSDSRHYDMVHKFGYQPFTVADLPDGISANSIGFRVAEDGQTLVRGVRGDEVIYKMAKASYDAIQMAKAEKNLDGMKSETKARNQAAEAVAAHQGSEAGDYIAKHATITIKDSKQPL